MSHLGESISIMSGRTQLVHSDGLIGSSEPGQLQILAVTLEPDARETCLPTTAPNLVAVLTQLQVDWQQDQNQDQ